MGRSGGRPVGEPSSPRSQRAQLMADLRRIAAAEPRFTYESLCKMDRALLQRLFTEFGSLALARKAARLPPLDRTRKWTRDRISDELRAVYRATGALTAAAITGAGRRDLLSAIQGRGGLVEARRLAGLPEPKPARRHRSTAERWDADGVVSEILDLHARDQSVAYSKVSRVLCGAGSRIFGSWRQAIEAAGLNYDDVRLVRPPYTREEIVELLQRLAQEQPQMLWGELY